MQLDRTPTTTPTPMRAHRRPWALWPLLVLMTVLVAGGFQGGISFVADPTGAGLGADLAWLERTPVDDFRWPGVALLSVFAVGTLLAMAGLVWRPSPGPLRRVDRVLGHHWSWVATIAIATFLIVWIVYEFAVLPATMFLQPALIGVAATMIGLCAVPSMRRHYRTFDLAAPAIPAGTPRRRAAFTLSLVAAVAATIGAIGGLGVRGIYTDGSAWATEALRGGDVVTLTLWVPSLLLAAMLARRGSDRALLVWLGALLYGVYDFAFYAFGASFNDVFLAHVIAFSASVFGLVALLPTIDATGIAARFADRTPRRLVSALLLTVAVVFAGLWTTFALDQAITGTLALGAATLPGMHLVFAIDLSLMVPSMALGGVWLWRRRPWGAPLATALCVFGALYQLNLAAAGLLQWRAGVEGVRAIDPVGAAFIVAFGVAAVAMLASLRNGRSSDA